MNTYPLTQYTSQQAKCCVIYSLTVQIIEGLFTVIFAHIWMCFSQHGRSDNNC